MRRESWYSRRTDRVRLNIPFIFKNLKNLIFFVYLVHLYPRIILRYVIRPASWQKLHSILIFSTHVLVHTFIECTHLPFSEYAQVTKMLGNGRLEAQCFDGTKRLCHIRGKLRKKVFKIKHSGFHVTVFMASADVTSLFVQFTKSSWCHLEGVWPTCRAPIPTQQLLMVCSQFALDHFVNFDGRMHGKKARNCLLTEKFWTLCLDQGYSLTAPCLKDNVTDELKR
jgi:initiation factor 1A